MVRLTPPIPPTLTLDTFASPVVVPQVPAPFVFMGSASSSQAKIQRVEYRVEGGEFAPAVDLGGNWARFSVTLPLPPTAGGPDHVLTVRAIDAFGTSNELYVGSQNEERITRVDLETGNREELVLDCPNTFGTLIQVLYNEGRNELLINGDRLLSVDLDTVQCTQVPRRVFTLHIQVTPEDQLFGTEFRALMQIDRETGEAVILSK